MSTTHTREICLPKLSDELRDLAKRECGLPQKHGFEMAASSIDHLKKERDEWKRKAEAYRKLMGQNSKAVQYNKDIAYDLGERLKDMQEFNVQITADRDRLKEDLTGLRDAILFALQDMKMRIDASWSKHNMCAGAKDGNVYIFPFGNGAYNRLACALKDAEIQNDTKGSKDLAEVAAENVRLRQALELAIQRIEEDREAFVSGLMVGEVMCPNELEAEAVKEYDDALSAARFALEGKEA